MKPADTTADLAVLVSDKNMEAAVRALCIRHKALGTRPISFDIFVHPEHDPGCLLKARFFLQAQITNYRFALVLFDREGSGSDHPAERLEIEVGEELGRSGWGARARVVVIDPELEAWIWSDSPHVDQVLGWANRPQPLRDWIVEAGFADRGASKPRAPKEAVEAALRVAKIQRSSSIYGRLATLVSLSRCQDRAFRRFRETMIDWFGTPDAIGDASAAP